MCSCALDTKPQSMAPDRQAVLRNVAGLVARELGKAGRAGQQQRPWQPRTQSSSQQALMAMDMSAPGWRVLYMSQHAADMTGAYALEPMWRLHADEATCCISWVSQE